MGKSIVNGDIKSARRQHNIVNTALCIDVIDNTKYVIYL